MTEPRRGASIERPVLQIDGKPVGPLMSFERRAAVGEAIRDFLTTHKILANERKAEEPITLSFGIGMGAELYEWIAAIVAGKATAKEGTISLIDNNGAEDNKIEWHDGHVSEVVFPTFDASTFAPSFRMTVQPWKSHPERGSGKKIALGSPGPSAKNASFRFSLNGIAVPKVTRIEPIIFRQEVIFEGGGMVVGAWRVEDVILSVPGGAPDDFTRWHDDFIIQGRSSEENERDGLIEILDAKGFRLFTLSLGGLGIVSLTNEPASGLAKVRMYCDHVAFDRAKP